VEPTGRIVSPEEFLGAGSMWASARVNLYPGTADDGEFLRKCLVFALINPPYGLFGALGGPRSTGSVALERHRETDLLFRTLDCSGSTPGRCAASPAGPTR
jgi:hypothetical protein